MAFLLDAKEYALKIIILNKRLKKIYNQLRHRKYPTTLLDEAIEKVRKMDRLSLLRPTPKKCSNKIRLITNYNPHEPQPSRYPKKIWTTADDKKISNHTGRNTNHL